MTTTSSLLALMTVIGLVTCCAGYPSWGSTYSQVSTHHAPVGWGGLGGLYGYGSLGGLGYGGVYGGGVHVAQSPVRYHGYSVGTPHVQSYGVNYPTPTVTHHHNTWHGGYGGFGLAGPVGHSVQTVSQGVHTPGWGLGYGLSGYGYY